MHHAQTLKLAALLLPALPAAAALAAEPAGMVMEAAGAPAVQPWQEVAANTTIELGAEGRVTFVHYRSCTTATAEGGRITFGAVAFDHQGGRLSGQESRCPERWELSGSGHQGGGMMMRAMPRLVAPAPELVLSGPGAEGVTGITLRRAGGDAVRLERSGPRLRWPAGAAPLAEGEDYELVVAGPAGERVQTVRAQAAAAPLVVLRVE
ncbi:MAG TPA: hypothetical protein VEH84_04095 [Alphaproteobacteria bacterium]|nr:hypothetical protein [Alphaproteobacteria bacterium]